MAPSTSSVASPARLTIRTPDDFHVHMRDGAVLSAVAPLTAAHFGRALVMPNLQPPVRTLEDAMAYRARILEALPPDTAFQPLMTLYLTDTTTPKVIRDAHASGHVVAVKLYPAGATTNSADGVTDLSEAAPALAAMEEVGMVLCVHGEMTGMNVDVFDREALFIRDVLPGLLSTYPRLRIVLEHATTADAVEVVQNTPGRRLAATVTAHHLLYSRSAIFAGAKIHPHMYCLPVLKRERHREALLQAVTNDREGRFFAGTDSAPHVRSKKICEDGCAGVFTAASAVALYAEAFQSVDALDRLEAFLSENGARFYGLSQNDGVVTLEARDEGDVVPSKIAVGGDPSDPIIPLRAGDVLSWTVTRSSSPSEHR